MGFSDFIGAGSSLLGAFGGSEETGAPSTQQQSTISGYYALPPQAQAAYNNYFNLINSLGNQSVGSYPKAQVGAPQSPFDSQELYNYQQANGGGAVKPVGFQEPFNQYQQNALSAMGAPDYSQQGLAQYFNPYQQNVIDSTLGDINHSYDIANSGIMDNNSRLNARAVGSSLGTQLAQNQQNRARDIGNASATLNSEGYNNALGLRNNSLQQQLAAGTAIQGQNQNLLNASNPQGQFALNPNYTQASLLSQLFGAFPNSSNSNGTNTGSTITDKSRQTTTLGNLGGLGVNLFGTGQPGSSGYLSSLFG